MKKGEIKHDPNMLDDYDFSEGLRGKYAKRYAEGTNVIDAMTPADWEPVRMIYLEGIASGQATFEMEAPTWQEWDAGHHPFARLVARLDGRVVGWAALSPVSRRRCYAGVAEVSIYVSAASRGRGIGRQLLLAAIAESERHGIWTLQGATFPENEASLRLQRACGFRELGRRERIAQQQGVWRDTILTERRSPVVGTEDLGPVSR
jgi:phosphinothricin acetyltransferase